MRIKKAIDENNPIWYESDDRTVYVGVRVTLLEYSMAERDSRYPYIAASYNRILAEAKSGFDEQIMPEVLSDALKLYAAFAMLHEIGHYVDHLSLGDEEYERLGCEQENLRRGFSKTDMELRADQNRKLPLESRADLRAKQWLHMLSAVAPSRG